MKKRYFTVLTSSLLLIFPLLSMAAGDALRGKAKAASCVACHGVGGNSTIPTFPNLAGQHAPYLVSALKAYRNGDRKAPVMQPMAAPLSDQDIEDLAAYYAAQKPLK